MKRILITGITGFVGTNLVRYLCKNERVQIIGHSRNVKEARTRFASYDIDFIEEISARSLDDKQIDILIHLAGIAHDLLGKYNADQYDQVNFRMTANIFDAFLTSRANDFIFISSIKSATDYLDEVITENTLPNPTSDYGISKKKAEDYILNNEKAGKRLFILRPCMIHGPGNKGNLNLLYKFVISGLPYPLGTFENKRSFLSIDNFCFVIQRIVEGKLNSGVYNLADSQPISTNYLVALIGKSANKKVRIIHFPRKLIFFLAKVGSVIHLPFNTAMLNKLIEDMEVSNKKLLLNLGEELPVSTEEGLIKTIESFNE